MYEVLKIIINHLPLIFIFLSGLIAIYYLLKYPEISLALFINAYVIKGGINIGYFN